MRFQRQLFTILLGVLTLLTMAPRESRALTAPPLRVTSFRELGYPTWLQRSELIWMLQKASDGLYGKAYADLGSMNDFYHGHLMMRGKGPGAKAYDNIEALYRPDVDWSLFEPVAILFHTKEDPVVVNGEPRAFAGPRGPLAPSSDRNWILWLDPQGPHARGTLESAVPYANFVAGPKDTVRSEELSPAALGETELWEYSVYFFAVDCREYDKIDANLREDSSLVEITQQLDQKRVCLAFENLTCRYSPGQQSCSHGIEIPALQK